MEWKMHLCFFSFILHIFSLFLPVILRIKNDYLKPSCYRTKYASYKYQCNFIFLECWVKYSSKMWAKDKTKVRETWQTCTCSYLLMFQLATKVTTLTLQIQDMTIFASSRELLSPYPMPLSYIHTNMALWRVECRKFA